MLPCVHCILCAIWCKLTLNVAFFYPHLPIATEWYKNHGEIVTVEQLRDVYNLPEKDNVEYAHKVDFLLWYMDCLLPAAAGASFDRTKRPYYRPTQTLPLYGKNRVIVESTTEAFGWLLVENCQKKWEAIFPEWKKNSDWKIPKYRKDDRSTHPFHVTTFTEPTGGQGVGWKPEARSALEKYKKEIHDFRTKDNKTKWKILNFCKDLIRKHHGITASSPASKKRKRAPRAKAALSAEDFQDVNDESDKEFSEHSEDSSGENEGDDGQEEGDGQE
jgi:hypothetical protein